MGQQIKTFFEKHGFGVITVSLLLVFVGAIGYALVSDESFVVSTEEASKDIPKEFIGERSELPIEGKAAEIQGIEAWINSEPLVLADLKGKVVLFDFWTYSCINCIRTIPHLKSWYEKYKDDGFIIVGIHTPEFEFERKLENVLAEVQKYELEYPVALDNNYATWNAFNNRFWPAHYLADVNGNIRFIHFGEGRYAETESAIQQLLLEAGLLSLDKFIEVVEPVSNVDFSQIGTPEIYLGASRINNFGSMVENVQINEPYEFPAPDDIKFNRFYLTGNWRITPEFSELVGESGVITIQYHASRAHIVLETKEATEVVLEIRVDGKYLNKDNKGDDVILENGKSIVRVREPRLYNLVNTQDVYETHTLEINVTSPGLQAFAFTFG